MHTTRASIAKAWLAALLLTAPGCGTKSETGGGGGSCTTSVVVEPFTQKAVDKIDVLLMIDNSRSMADKQLILAAAVPDLVGALVNPKCVDLQGTPMTTQPATATEPCPVGLVRDFNPITSLHIGVVTSSLGGHGGDACSVTDDVKSCPGGANPSNNDAGHLISRKDACGGAAVTTYGNKGFLAWDPEQKLVPPGEANLGTLVVDGMGNVTTGTPGIVPSLKDLVLGTGQVGCDYEAQLESWYRFLIDPEPYKDITLQNGKAVPSGTDLLLLQQRADFLRPSSLLAILMLTDENDCSVKESGQFYYAVQQQSPQDSSKKLHLPRARQECATNPNDPCCKSCGQSAQDCPADAMCSSSPWLTDAEDDLNLRCFDQKRRFGIDFLYGIDRYRDALSSRFIPNRAGMMVVNPIFADLNPSDNDSAIRDKDLVMLAGIVGVPWQDIARDSADLTKGFKNAQELSTKDAKGVTTWDVILGDPASYVAPKDPHMIESVQPRNGLPGPTSPPGADPISGHEHTTAGDDLQYACVFPLPAPRDCTVIGASGCDCTAGSDNPLCDPAAKTTQVRAKAYPGTRELSVLRGLDDRGVVASICAKQTTNPGSADYGYRPAVRAILERVKASLGTGQCLARQITADPSGSVECVIVEAHHRNGACSCDPVSARLDVPESHQGIIKEIQQSSFVDPNGACFCEIPQAAGAELSACQNDISPVPFASGKPVNGWCYVDGSTSPPVGNPSLVALCPAAAKRLLRFVGAGAPAPGTQEFIACELVGHCPGGSQ